MSNSIRYSITIVQFNLSNLIGFDCLFLGLSPLSIQELRSRCGGIPRQTRTLAATSLSPRRSWNFSPDSAAGADSGPLEECSEIHCAWVTLEKRKGCDTKALVSGQPTLFSRPGVRGKILALTINKYI